jgi:hypothetical protein
VLATVKRWLDGAAEVTAGAKPAANNAKMSPNRMFAPNVVGDMIILGARRSTVNAATVGGCSHDPARQHPISARFHS